MISFFCNNSCKEKKKEGFPMTANHCPIQKLLTDSSLRQEEATPAHIAAFY